MSKSAVWQIIEEWLKEVPFPPSQSKIAERVGVSRSAVSDWKSGKTKPDPRNLTALAQMMEPQLGPTAYERLVIALLDDMGYLKISDGANVTLENVTFHIPGGEPVVLSAKVHRSDDLPDTGNLDSVIAYLKAGDPRRPRHAILTEGKAEASLIGRYVEQAEGRWDVAARLLAHDGAAGANVDEDVWLRALTALGNAASTPEDPQEDLASMRQRVDDLERRRREQHHTLVEDLEPAADDQPTSIEREQDETERST